MITATGKFAGQLPLDGRAKLSKLHRRALSAILAPTEVTKIRVLHVLGGTAYDSGTTVVVQDLVDSAPADVESFVWMHRDFVSADGRFIAGGYARTVNKSVVAGLFSALAEVPLLVGAIRGMRISVLHAHTRVGIFAAWVAHWLVGRPLLIHLHFLAAHPWFYRFLMRNCRGTVVYNSRKTCLHYGDDARFAAIVHPTLDWPTDHRSGVPPRRIVAASAPVASKRLDIVIASCAALYERGEELQVVICALIPESIAPPAQTQLTGAAQEKPYVRLAPWSREWAKELRDGDVFVHVGRPESFGLVVLEAFALGAKVVVLRDNFISEFAAPYSEAGIYYADELSASHVADAISRALSDAVTASELRCVRSALRPLFSKEAASDKVATIYERLVGKTE